MACPVLAPKAPLRELAQQMDGRMQNTFLVTVPKSMASLLPDPGSLG